MSYSFHVNNKNFTKSAIAAVERIEKSPYLRDIIFDGNVLAEFSGKEGKIIRMVIKPDGSYAIKTFAPHSSGNALRSEYDKGVFRDLLRSIEIKIADKKSKFDILQSCDFTGNFSVFKQYLREKGEKLWTIDKRVF